jgi:transposase-like protein
MNTPKRIRRIFDPQQKITAVLSIWTERRTIRQLCREMSISPVLLNQWQNQAMEGMLEALGPRKPEGPRQMVSDRLTRLIAKNLADPTAKLTKRLVAVQKAKANLS